MAEIFALVLPGLLLMTLGVINVYGIWLLRRHSAFARFVPVQDLQSVVPAHDPRGLELLAKEFQSSDYLQLLTQVMNSVGTCGPGPSADPLEAFRHVRFGGGLQCAGMANLYFNVLRVNGLNARQVYLSRTCFDTVDTHVTVEVLVDGKWVIADPTFHTGFEKHGKLVGAQTISESLRNGSLPEIRPKFYGPVKYPNRLESYYIPWSTLFHNVFVVDRDQPRVPLWARIPPFRYWCGPVMYYQRDPGVSPGPLRLQARLYALFIVSLPVTLLGFTSLLVAGLFLG